MVLGVIGFGNVVRVLMLASVAVLQSLVINTVFSRYTVSSLEHENREDS